MRARRIPFRVEIRDLNISLPYSYYLSKTEIPPSRIIHRLLLNLDGLRSVESFIYSDETRNAPTVQFVAVATAGYCHH